MPVIGTVKTPVQFQMQGIKWRSANSSLGTLRRDGGDEFKRVQRSAYMVHKLAHLQVISSVRNRGVIKFENRISF